MKRLLRLPAVEDKTGLKHSQIYEDIAKGTFPAPVPLGVKAVAWVESEIDAWIDARIAARARERGDQPAATAAEAM
jgi:prophage regulatory protein